MNESDLSLSYNFTPEEIKLLAKFFRRNQESLPDGLFAFLSAIERTIYNALPMKEVATFYS
ncbi:MAG: hypothetical protein II921_00025 [Treponema sp.]|nr:hypothetical protein [Treponema sp.]